MRLKHFASLKKNVLKCKYSLPKSRTFILRKSLCVTYFMINTSLNYYRYSMKFVIYITRVATLAGNDAHGGVARRK